MALENVLDRGLANHRLLGTVNKGANLVGSNLARPGRVATGKVGRQNCCTRYMSNGVLEMTYD